MALYERFDLCMTREGMQLLAERLASVNEETKAPHHARGEVIVFRNELRARLQHMDAEQPEIDELLR
jgi:hypothetical protein